MFEQKTLSVNAMTLAVATTSALFLGAVSLLGLSERDALFVRVLRDLLPGFDASGAGLFLAIVWGFLLGGIAGYLISWLYNKMV